MNGFVIAGSAVYLIGISSYLKDVLRGRGKPNRVTWFLWSAFPMLATVAAISDGARWSALPIFMSGFCPFLVLIASFVNPQSYWKIQPLDYVCGALSVLGIMLWLATDDPLHAVLLAICSDAMAAAPTVWKSLKYPETESLFAYATSLLSALSSFTAMNAPLMSEIAFPVYLVVQCSTIVLAILVGKAMKRSAINVSQAV